MSAKIIPFPKKRKDFASTPQPEIVTNASPHAAVAISGPLTPLFDEADDYDEAAGHIMNALRALEPYRDKPGVIARMDWLDGIRGWLEVLAEKARPKS